MCWILKEEPGQRWDRTPTSPISTLMNPEQMAGFDLLKLEGVLSVLLCKCFNSFFATLCQSALFFRPFLLDAVAVDMQV